jgi:hypothetical protein
MTLLVDPATMLRDPEVTRFFLALLESDLTAEAKYARFIEFFESGDRIGRELLLQPVAPAEARDGELDRRLAAAGESAGVWRPAEILRTTEDCLRRALHRLLASQHRDGGWGYQVEATSAWATAWAVRFLAAARADGLADERGEKAAEQGFQWLLDHREGWSIDSVLPRGRGPVYDATLVMRCAYRTGRAGRPEVAELLARSLKVLNGAQNDDGGWDAYVWGSEPEGPTRCWSDVGATSTAIRTLVLSGEAGFEDAVRRGVEALVRHQRADGGWAILFSEPDAPSANKTCDGLRGILAACRAGLDLEPYRAAVERAVAWLRRDERPVVDRERGVSGWGWSGSELSSALETTCLILETLVHMSEIPLPLLASNARWLVESQLRSPGSPEDGDWPNKDTARIALSLLEFYRQIQKSPWFTPASDETP